MKLDQKLAELPYPADVIDFLVLAGRVTGTWASLDNFLDNNAVVQRFLAENEIDLSSPMAHLPKATDKARYSSGNLLRTIFNLTKANP